ncbi:hypothetical protein, partial [Salmonella sp. SAL04269]|uniref:hypothetical protein n=1 Tax=Salmonella sp. SAL04269 TaxID=3159847 RepID=UPI00397C37BC
LGAVAGPAHPGPVAGGDGHEAREPDADSGRPPGAHVSEPAIRPDLPARYDVATLRRGRQPVKLLFFDDFKLGVLKDNAVVDVSPV